MRQTLIDTAREYRADGISITLTDDRKVSVGPWKDFQTRFITDQELNERSDRADGIAIICGAISGNLEVVDIDLKYDVTGTLWDRLLSSIPESIADKLVIAQTKSKGIHLYYRVASVLPNTKLARRPATDQEQNDNPHVRVMVLIETRGSGGYVVAPPSNGYQWISGTTKDLTELSEAERDELFTICRTFNEYLDEPVRMEKIQTDVSYGISPLDDFNQHGDMLQLLNKHGWTSIRTQGDRTYLRRPGKTEGISGDYLHSKRWFSVFTTSSEFEPNKAYNASAVFCILECNGDWKQTVRQLASNGYGKNEREVKRQNKFYAFIDKMVQDGDDDETIHRQLQKAFDQTPHEASQVMQSYQDHKKDERNRFWIRERNERISIVKTRLLDFLTNKGFRMMAYDPDGNDVRLVNIQNNILSESSTEKVKKSIYEYVTSIGGDEADLVASSILDKHQLFGESFLEFLPKITPDILSDTKDAAYYPFRNGIVMVTRNNVELIKYGSIDKQIWKSHIKDFDIEVFDNDQIEFNFDNRLSDVFPKFIYLICGESETRFTAFCTAIGYLIHKYKDPTIPVAIILAEETDNDAKGGGTGKGIFVTAISHMVRTETIDGKNFKLDKSFAFQRVKLDTKLIAIQDIRAKVDFEGFYSIITEGITIEKKGQNEVFLPFEVSPKLVFTTNYSIPDTGNHAQRRQRVIPFGDYFSPSHTPMDEFGHQLFSDWDRGQWLAFYNYMFLCCRMYMNNGIINVPVTDTMRLKSLKTSYGNEFKEWFNDYRMGTCSDWKQFGELYRSFINMFDMNESEFTRKRFRSGIVAGASAFGFKIETVNRGPAGGLYYRMINDSFNDIKRIDLSENTETVEISNV